LVDIYITLSAFKKMVKTHPVVSGDLFESKERLLTTFGGITVHAMKNNGDRIYPEAIPFKKIGYTTIATNTDELPQLTEDEAADDIRETLSALPEDQREAALKKGREEVNSS